MSNQSNYQGLSGIFIGLGVLLMVLGVLFLVEDPEQVDAACSILSRLRMTPAR